MYTTYLPQNTASFLRMKANLFSFIFCYFHSLPTTFLSPPLCSLQPSFPRGSPHHFSPDGSLCRAYSTCGLGYSTSQPLWQLLCWYLADWGFSAFFPETDYRAEALFHTSSHCPYFILIHTVKMAFNKYWLNKYLFNRPNNLAKDIWNKTTSHLGNTITCKAGSF